MSRFQGNERRPLFEATVLDERDLVGIKLKIEGAQVSSHVIRIRRSGQRGHANLQCEAEDELWNRATMFDCDLG